MSEVVRPGDPWSALERGDAGTPRAKPGKRTRVVLAEGRKARRVVRTLADVEEQTGVGELLVRQLVRAQLMLAIRFGLLAAGVLGALPVAFVLLPVLGRIEVLGVIRLPWLLLGFAVYPFLLWVAWMYKRGADANELEFTEMVES